MLTKINVNRESGCCFQFVMKYTYWMYMIIWSFHIFIWTFIYLLTILHFIIVLLNVGFCAWCILCKRFFFCGAHLKKWSYSMKCESLHWFAVSKKRIKLLFKWMWTIKILFTYVTVTFISMHAEVFPLSGFFFSLRRKSTIIVNF